MDIRRQRQVPCLDRLRIMIAAGKIDVDAGVVEPSHRTTEIKSGSELVPLAVVEIAGEDDEGDSSFDGEPD